MKWLHRRPHSAEPGAWRLGFASGFAAFAALLVTLAYIASVVVSFTTADLGPPRTVGVPLRVVAGETDAVLLMTVQKESRTVGGGGRWSTHRGFETVTHFDVWRLDGATAQPVWRKRLATEREAGNIHDLGVLGADGDRFWLFLRGPVVASIATGEVLAGAAAIEDRNPALKDVRPLQSCHYICCAGYELVFTAADARAWQVDAATLEAAPWAPKTAARRPSAIGPPQYASSSLSTFQKRG